MDGPDLEQWRAALSEPTTAVFFESPSNPMQEIVDIAAVSELAHAAGATVVVDNVFATPLLQRCGDLGADVIVYSGTKHIDGQGRVLGGAILGTKEFIDGPGQAAHAAHRPGAVRVQRLGPHQGPGDHGAARNHSSRLRAAAGRMARGAARRQLGQVPAAAVAPAVRARRAGR